MTPPRRRVRAVLVGDDGVFLVYSDGTLERFVPGGHGARPVGWSVEPVATQRTRAA